jgi:hypothetical protein
MGLNMTLGGPQITHQIPHIPPLSDHHTLSLLSQPNYLNSPTELLRPFK